MEPEVEKNKSIYQPAVALGFFKAAGKVEKFEQSKTIFSENESGDSVFSGGNRMYFLGDGEVSLIAGKKVIGTVRKGEIFGEMAAISQLPRTATAVAKTPCTVVSLNDKQFQAAIAKSPEFALMMMSIVISRLRETGHKLVGGGKITGDDWNKAAVFDKKLLTDLEQEFEDKPPQLHPLNKVIMKEGDRGIFMYVVHEGVVGISINEKVVEKVGPGGVFGEMALVDQSARAATAMAEEDCSLLAINRNDFLELVKRKPEFVSSLLKALAERLRFMTSKYK